LLQSSSVGVGSKANGGGSGQPQTGGGANSAGSAKQQQSQQPQQQHQSQQHDPKPVECNLCHRKFKNIPALNGHMRLHGGYFKKASTGFSISVCWRRALRAEDGSAVPCERSKEALYFDHLLVAQ
jgi:hypothetical protein